jgi:hypothetical protein
MRFYLDVDLQTANYSDKIEIIVAGSCPIPHSPSYNRYVYTLLEF